MQKLPSPAVPNSVSWKAVTLVDLRLLALGEFPGADGQAEALAAADQDRHSRQKIYPKNTAVQTGIDDYSPSLQHPCIVALFWVPQETLRMLKHGN